MTVPKKRRDTTKMSGDELSSSSAMSPNATLVLPRRSIHSYSNESNSIYSRSEQGIVSGLFSSLIRVMMSYSMQKEIWLRIVQYFVMILLLSLFRDYLFYREDFLSTEFRRLLISLKVGDRSWFNIYTVKIGWFWTLISIVPFMLYTRHEAAKRDSRKNCNEKRNFFLRLLPCVVRVAIMTSIWYFSVEFFVLYADRNGECQRNPAIVTKDAVQKTEFYNRIECKQNGHTWIHGFDISGHIFLMIFSNLVRFEEMIYLIKNFEEFIEFRYNNFQASRVQNYCGPFTFNFNVFYIRTFIYLFLYFAVTVVWDFMIIQTSLYYHTTSQKMIGFIWAVLCWLLTYKWLYPKLNLKV